MSKHKIIMTTEECFEVINILENYFQKENVDKHLLSAYNKLNVKIPNVKQNFNHTVKEFEPRKEKKDEEI